ncbi:MAG: F0F1 ATP synthase subunit epsilon [Actinomycetales bacterium]|nr:F0F1 ATP synthase subunit epsilon [Actinomycetales bacterium]
MAELEVDVVAADRRVWRGAARMVSAPAADGDIGILPGHTPLLAILRAGDVRIQAVDGAAVTVTVDEGFLSVDDDKVTVVAHAAVEPSGDGGRRRVH